MTSIFDSDEFKALQPRWMRRQQELTRRRSLYDGTFYTSGSWKWLKWLAPGIYKGTKALYLPFPRAVDVDAGIVPAKWEFPSEEDEPRSEAWSEARDKLFAWSRWKTLGVLYVHYGAQYGVSGLKVADLRDRKKVVIAPVDPATFMLLHETMYDDTPALALVVEKREDSTGAAFEYAELITADAIRTFKDGAAHGYDGRQPEYRNELGFVPFAEVKHLDSGRELGEATFVKAEPLLSEVNELASYLADIIAKHAEPQWAAMGAEASDLVKSGDNIWFMPNGSDLKAIIAAIDIPGVLEFIREIAANVKEALPELAFDELRKKDQIATATLELQLMEMVLKIKRVRPNYDEGLVSGFKMSSLAAQSMGVHDLDALNDEDLTLDDERPVLPLDPETAMRIEMQALALEREKSLGSSEGMGNGRDTDPALRDGDDPTGEPLHEGDGERVPNPAPQPA